MSPLAEFQGCRDRIAQAETHSRAMADMWNALLEDELYSAALQMEDDGTGHLRVGHGYDSLPQAFALELGELLYQLRAALDSCVYAAAILESGQEPPPDHEHLEFPVVESVTDFRKAAWKIRPLTDARRTIIESVQPYNVPDIEPELMVFNFNRALRILNDWGRKDRHRKLHVVGSWASDANPKVDLPDGCDLEYMFVTTDGLLEHDGLIATFKLSGYVPGMDVKANPDLAIDIAVDEPPEPCADNDTLSNRLRGMIIATKAIVRGVEDSFAKPT